MCGISGILNPEGVETRQIKSMSDIVRHRGPDGEGFMIVNGSSKVHCFGGIDTPSEVWSSEFPYSPDRKIENHTDSKFTLSFAHRRLSILDLSPAGHQPMSYAEGRFWIIFNGEIYNYRDLKSELQGLGHNFISRTDTEVVLAAYAQWGEKCLERLVGMWAFAIYDHELKEIFLARDRYGIKPLYYWFSPGGQFQFASEIKQFTVLDGWQPKANPQMVYDYLIYSFTDHTEATMFSGVYQLPSGSCYRSAIGRVKPDSSGRIEHRKWYNIKHDPFIGSFTEAAVEFRSLFERSVKEHLHADVSVGTALSGGLDSSSIVCEVNKLLRNSGHSELQKTFSSCSVNEKFNEKKWMDIIIEQTRVDAHFIYPELNDLFKVTQDIIWYQDEPYQSQSVFLGYNVFKLSRANGVKVLLNGQGADEYLGGYSQFTFPRYADMVRHFRFGALAKDVKNLRKIRPVGNQELVRGIAFSLLPTSLVRSLTSLKSTSDHIKMIIDTARLNSEPRHPYDSIPVSYNTIPEISEHYTFYSTLPKYLRWEDRNSMAHSVEARVPFLDHRLVEFSYNLPDNFLEKDGITKRVMRQAMNDLLPEKIKNRKDKMGFITPEEIWVTKDNPGLFREKISEAVEMTNGVIKPEALTFFDNIVAGKLPFDYTYWRLILFNQWAQKFGIKI